MPRRGRLAGTSSRFDRCRTGPDSLETASTSGESCETSVGNRGDTSRAAVRSQRPLSGPAVDPGVEYQVGNQAEQSSSRCMRGSYNEWRGHVIACHFLSDAYVAFVRTMRADPIDWNADPAYECQLVSDRGLRCQHLLRAGLTKGSAGRRANDAAARTSGS